MSEGGRVGASEGWQEERGIEGGMDEGEEVRE